jgi:hypothetical protein
MSGSSFLLVVPKARGNVSPVVRRDDTGLALYAGRAYAPGEVVFDFKNISWSTDRDKFTVEHTSGAHLFHPLLAKSSHGCDPNGRLDIRGRVMVAIRPIAAGDRIAIDYAATERRISHPFACLCRSANCRGRIG